VRALESEGLDHVTLGLGWESFAMSELRTVRKHSNRRLYYPDGRRYVTLADVYGWVVDGVDVYVVDVDTGVDVTCDVLFQVMAAQEQTASPSMSRDFLLQAIRAGARASGGMVATFLEQSMNLFKNLQGNHKNPGSAAQQSPAQMAQRFAETNCQRWRAMQGQISRMLANAQSPATSAGGRPSEMIAAPSGLGPARRLKRLPRPPAARARR
jgi:polyhydroxyalkanoate synthesis repressor PhaR